MMHNLTHNKELADLLFPDIDKTPEQYELLYPKRQLPEGAKVTRFAPSPTGYVHMGSLYASLVSERLAHQSNGVIFLRVEDTDKKREVEGGVSNIVRALSRFGINFDEGVTDIDDEKGSYGPYKQSERMDIYKSFAKRMVEKGFAYPCFCSEEDLDKIRSRQEEKKITPGYYGEYAVHRNSTLEQVKEELSLGKSFVLRVKAPNNPDSRFILNDLIKGDVEMPENFQDMVLLKSDGLPTYHFAHVVDDHLMRTTHVTSGDEWLSSAPLHIQLFEMLELEKPYFAHISPIMKIEGSSKRKLSKRKDPEADVSFYHEQGFPSISVIEYLVNLTNSNFEDWRRENPKSPNTDFEIELERMSVSGAMFDLIKLTDMSKDIVAGMTAEEVYDMSLKWASEYDSELWTLLSADEKYAKSIFNIDRGGEKPRKDIAKWTDVKPNIFYFFDDLFDLDVAAGRNFPEAITSDEVSRLIREYSKVYNHKDNKDMWFDRVKEFCEEMGYSKDVKTFKKNPGVYKGHVGDVTGVIRVAVTNRRNTPDLYEIMQVMGEKKVMERFDETWGRFSCP
ncbi:MAG: glutamate--tRNA ligase [Clostridiaceae bacterium]|nr:glutamate--tRNA ligase [Clostridiaceae bacterium]